MAAITTGLYAKKAGTFRSRPRAEKPRGLYLGRFRRPPRRDARRRSRRLGGLGARDRSILHREAALEGAIDLLFHRFVLLARHLGDLGDDEELRAIEHALLAEREVLRAGQEGQA